MRGDVYPTIWTRPGAAVFEQKVAGVPGTSSFTKRAAGAIGHGEITVPGDWDQLNTVIQRIPGTPASDVRRLVRFYQEQTSGPALVVFESFLDKTDDEFTEGLVKIDGPGLESLMMDAIVEAWDWDGLDEQESQFPDWIWGGKDIVGPVETSFAPHIFEVWNNGTSGSFQVGISADGAAYQYASINFNDTASQVEVAIEGLSNVTAAKVTGSGTESNPWQIEIEAPSATYTAAIGTLSLGGGGVARLSMTQFGKLLPIGWTISLIDATPIPHGQVTDFRASLGGGADPALPAGCDAWIVFDGQEQYYPGVQKRIRVIPGGLYQVTDDLIIRSTSATTFRIVIRDIHEQLICQEEITVAANTNTNIVGFSCTIPDGITEAVFRIGHIGSGDPGPVYIACPSMREGLPPTSPGGIMDALFDDATVNHVADGRVVWENLASVGTSYIDPTFTVGLDTDGVVWDDLEMTFTAQRGKSYFQVLTDLSNKGYKWRLRSGATPGRINFDLFNKGWVDQDATAAASPAINVGSGVTAGPIFRSHQTGNAVTAEGAQLRFGRAESATSIAAIGRRETYLRDLTSPTLDQVTLRAVEEVASRLLSGLSVALKISPTTGVGPVPCLDYDVDWQVNVQVPPILAKSAHRVAALTCNIGEVTTWQASFSSESFTGIQGLAEATNRLMLKFNDLERIPDNPIDTPIIGGGGAPTIVIAASNSSEYSMKKADLFCSGVNDEGTIQKANDLLIGTGGRILLCEGLFSLSMAGATSHAIKLSNGVTLLGMGQTLTTLSLAAGNPSTSGLAVISTFGAPGAIRDLLMESATIGTNPPHLIRTTNTVELSGLYLADAPQDAISCGSGNFPAHISHVHIETPGRDGVSLTSAGNVRLVSVFVDSAGRYGVYSSSSGGTMVGVQVTGSVDHDFYLDGYTGALVACSSTGPDNDGYTLEDCAFTRLVGCESVNAGNHGIRLIDSSDCVVDACTVSSPSVVTDNTYDGIILEGDSNRNSVQNNRIKSSTVATQNARYGINVSAGTCDNNVINDNVAGPAADFGTGAYNDAGTGTQGTNFTI